MTHIDWPTLINWIVSGLIGCIFGIVSTYFYFRLERIRHDEVIVKEYEKSYKLFLQEAEHAKKENEQREIRAALMAGIDRPEEAIKELEKVQSLRSGPRIYHMVKLPSLESLQRNKKLLRISASFVILLEIIFLVFLFLQFGVTGPIGLFIGIVVGVLLFFVGGYLYLQMPI